MQKPISVNFLFLCFLSFLATSWSAAADINELRARGGGGGGDGDANYSPHHYTPERKLYEADDEKKCLDDDFCRMSLGILLILFTPLIICWNEHALAKLEKLYRAAERNVHMLHDPFFGVYHADNNRNNDASKEADEEQHLFDLDGKFICTNGTLGGGVTLQDPLFPSKNGVVVKDALLLLREIEIFQYVEVRDSNDNIKIKKKWCQLPQPDLTSEDKKNPVGNWDLFGGEGVVDTGRTFRGVPVLMKENFVLFRAPHPTLGSFAIPPELMNEGFMGTRNVQRLHELQRIKESQGIWKNFVPSRRRDLVCNRLPPLQSLRVNLACGYVYDGDQSTVGTIRIRWKYAQTQPVTIAAEAVAPGRPSAQGYGVSGRNLDMANPRRIDGMKDMILEELFNTEATPDELTPLSVPTNNDNHNNGQEHDSCGAPLDSMSYSKKGAVVDQHKNNRKVMDTNHEEWTFTPFAVTEPRIFSLYGQEKFLGQLWLFAPGKLTSRQLFRKAHIANEKCSWSVRILTYMLLLIGWMLVFGPLTRWFGPGIFRSLLVFTFGMVAIVLSSACWITFSVLACFTARPVRSILILSLLWGSYVWWDHNYSITTVVGTGGGDTIW